MYKYLLLIFLALASCKRQEPGVLSKELTDWEFEYEGEWYAAKVPGNNFSDLLNHSFIKDPFYGTNEDSVQWISENDWQYRSNFILSENILKKTNHLLCFEGIDTYAKIYLNDSLLLYADNMFRKWEINLKQLLKK